MVTLDKTKYYYLDNLTMRQLQEVADAILADPKEFKVNSGDFTNAKGLFKVEDITFKNKKVCII